jgi:hypothetical protein
MKFIDCCIFFVRNLSSMGVLCARLFPFSSFAVMHHIRSSTTPSTMATIRVRSVTRFFATSKALLLPLSRLSKQQMQKQQMQRTTAAAAAAATLHCLLYRTTAA